MSIYENIKKNSLIESIEALRFTVDINFVDGCFVEIKSGLGKYTVNMYDADADFLHYTTTITPGMWAKSSHKYFINWRIVIIDEMNYTVLDQTINLNNNRVLISLDSKSLGDTLAWFPYVEEFRKKHNCTVICSTFLNDLFKHTYPDIEFVSPGSTVENISAQYNLGWYYNGERIDTFRNPSDPKLQPMQKTAADILGLEYKEIKPRLSLPTVVAKEDTITLGIHSTAQAKYWNHPTGWQEVVDYIKSINYTPLLLSKEEDGYMGNKHPEGIVLLPPSDLNTVITELCKSKLFIGVGSGLSWLAWACNIPTILISGFSEPYTEFECYRITAPDGVCHGCFNRHKLNPSDWNWCPEHKDTDRQFECSKSILPETVISTIKTALNEL